MNGLLRQYVLELVEWLFGNLVIFCCGFFLLFVVQSIMLCSVLASDFRGLNFLRFELCILSFTKLRNVSQSTDGHALCHNRNLTTNGTTQARLRPAAMYSRCHGTRKVSCPDWVES